MSVKSDSDILKKSLPSKATEPLVVESIDSAAVEGAIEVSLDLPLTPDGVSGRISGKVAAGMKLLVYFATPL